MTGRKASARSVTSRDVAREAQVSQGMVSRAFTGNGRIAEGTRQRVLKVAAQLGWQPNALAASMVTGDAPLVAVITTRLNFDWRAQVLSHLLRAFEERRVKPLLFYADSDEEVDRLLVETMSWRSRGVVVTAGVVSPARAEAILAQGQFLAALNRPANHAEGFAIATDNGLGGRMAGDVLVGDGRQRPLVLAGPAEGWATALRTEGFVAGMRERGIEPIVWHNDAMSVEAGKACAERMLALPRSARPDSVFSTNDAMALGFLDGLRGNGVEVPDDLSLIGFDNLPAAAWTPYQLTTFEQPLDAMVGGVLGHIEAHQTRRNGGEPPPAAQTPSPDGVIYCPPRLIRRRTAGEVA